MTTKIALEKLLKQVSTLYPYDRFAPGIVVSFLPADRNTQARRIADKTRKKYDVKAGEACWYGSVKRFRSQLLGDQVVFSFKSKSIIGLARGLSKELERALNVKG